MHLAQIGPIMNRIVSVQKWWISVQAKAAAMSQPEA